MNSLSGFNSQEIRRLHPYLSALLRRLRDIEKGNITITIAEGSGGGGGGISYGTDADIMPTGDRNSAGTLNRVARADHQHLFKFPTTIPVSTPNGSAYFDLSASAIKIYVGGSPTTKVVAGGTTVDVQPTGAIRTGTAPRYAFADHSHPTAILPQNDPQSPVANEIRFSADNKVVRWDGSAWVPLSVETITVEWGTDADVQPTKRQSAGSSTRFARADHSHPTAILPQSDAQTPVADEIRYDADNKLVRWNGSAWVPLSVETFTIDGGTDGDIAPTGLRSAGVSTRFARADHSHPTAILPQSNSQPPVVNEIRFTSTNQLVRWNGSAWVNFAGGFPVPANPLILPYDNQVSSPQDRQLVNHSSWDNIGNATIFYYDANSSQYRLVFARPLVVSITSNPSGKDVWSNTVNEMVLKRGAGSIAGSVLWNRRGNSTDWSPVSIQLSDDTSIIFPSDVGVLTRSPLTGTSGRRRWFLRGVQEDGSFRAPFVGFATFTESTTPAPADLATNLNDGYAYYIHDLDRVDIVRPIAGGNTAPTMLPHYVIAPTCRTFITTGSGHYFRDEQWNGMWVIRFYTTTTATTDLTAILPTIAVPLGIQAGRVLLYLFNPQNATITTNFAVAIRRLTSTLPIVSTTSNTPITIPANTGVVADLGVITFPPSTTLAHHRAQLLSVSIIRRRTQEASNANSVICFGVVIVPQRI